MQAVKKWLHEFSIWWLLLYLKTYFEHRKFYKNQFNFKRENIGFNKKDPAFSKHVINLQRSNNEQRERAYKKVRGP